MTNEQILKKAIEKAMKGGFEYMGEAFESINEYKGFNLDGRLLYRRKDEIIEKMYPDEFNRDATNVDCQSVFDIIFSHDFAKAFWGDPEGVKYFENNPKRTPVKIWQFHLRQMVLEKEPLKYLKKFL